MNQYSKLQCEPCQYKNITKSASNWCVDCEESFCDECSLSHKALKISRNHHVISAEDYEKTKNLNFNLKCLDHSKRFDFYCPTHDSVVCVSCVQFNHDSCKDLRPLIEAANGVKTSTALIDLEQTIEGLLENIENGVRHLQQNKIDLKAHEDVTKKSVAKKRTQINKLLDRLEGKFLNELESNTEKAVKEISLMTTKLETKRKHILDLNNTIQNMKTLASNLQVFVGIRSILETVVYEINGIKLLVSNIPQLCVTVQVNPKFDTFSEGLDSLGNVEVTSQVAVVPYVERRVIQAQYQRPTEQLDESPVYKLDNLQLKLKRNIKMGKSNSSVNSCLILPNKSIMIASGNKPSLTILKEDGSHDRDISVPYNPYGATIIDDQRVAISYGYRKNCISIINPTHNTNQSFENVCNEWIRGISYSDGKLYAVARSEGIHVINLDGNNIKTIRIYKDAWDTYKVILRKEKIYFTAKNRSVYCVDMEGTEIWTYQDDRLQTVLYSPAIAVDNYGITFATGYNNNLLLAISPDGRQHKVLLTSSDGLQNPEAVYYDQDSQQILICNRENGHAALYDVIY